MVSILHVYTDDSVSQLQTLKYSPEKKESYAGKIYHLTQTEAEQIMEYFLNFPVSTVCCNQINFNITDYSRNATSMTVLN